MEPSSQRRVVLRQLGRTDQGDTLKETVPVPKWKWDFVESEIQGLQGPRYQVEIDKTASNVTISGNEDGVLHGRERVSSVLASIESSPIDGISQKLASILDSPLGKATLLSVGFEGALTVDHGRVFLVAPVAKMENLRKRIAAVIQESVLNISEVDRAFVHTGEWQKLSERLESEWLVEVDVSLSDKEIYIRGTDPEHAVKEIQKFLNKKTKGTTTAVEKPTTKKTEDCISPIRPEVWKFLEKYHQIGLQELKARTRMKSGHGCMMLEISGSSDEVQYAKAEIKKLLAAVKTDSSVINKIGAGAVFGSTGGKTMLRGLEQMYSSVIEEKYGTEDQPSDHSTKCFKEEKPLSTGGPPTAPKRAVPVKAKVSAEESEGEEGYLLRKEGNVSLRLYRGDITKHRADVLVNTPVAGCEGFSTAGAVAKAFLKVGGKELEQAFSKLSPAALVSTQAYGDLKPICKKVYHLRIGSWSQNTQQDLQKKLDICLKQCATDGYSSIAFPPVGCGNLKYPVSAVAECFKAAVVKHSEGTHTAKVAIIAYESGTFRDMQQAFGCADGNSETRAVGVDDLLKASAKLTVVDMLSDNPIERFILRSMVKHEFIQRVQQKGKQESDSLLLYSKSTFSLFLHRGEITSHRADVLVNTTVAGTKGFVGAVAKAFVTAGGEALEKQYLSQSGGTVVATKPCGDLEKACQRVYHLKLSHWKPETEKELESQLAKCLEKCISDGFSSIAFPTVGCGGLGYPADKVAISFKKTIDKMAKGKLKVTIVAYESDLYNKFAAFFNGDALDIKIGDWVRVKPGITMPKFGWGAINSKSVGRVLVIGSQEANARVFVSFKADNEWKGVVGEMEVVESAGKVNLNIGDKVKVRPEIGTPKYEWGEVSDKSVGAIVWIGQDDEGLEVKVDFPEQEGWKGLAREMELVQSSGASRRFSVGDTVKVKPAIKSPKYGWGSVTTKSVGFVVAMEAGGKMRVTFPEKSYWLADAQEMELVVAHFGVLCDGCEQCPLAGPRYKCRQCDDFDFCESCFNENETHRHQFNKISRPGQAAVPLSVTYSGNSEDKSLFAVHRSRQLRPSFKIPNNLVFHVYALTHQAVKDTLKGIHEFLEESLAEDIVEHRKLKDPPQELVKRLQNLSSSKVAVRVDTAARKVVITGVSKDVVSCRREVDKILSSLSENRHAVPKYWTRQKGKTVFDVDDKLAKIVSTVVKRSWEAEKVGRGKDAVGLRHKTIQVTRVQRIENSKIWAEYQAKRSVYGERVKASICFPHLGQTGKDVMTRGFGLEHFVKEKTNEVFLFHGTTPENKDAIIMQGLDSRVGNSSGMFGKGVYFSESSTKADQYTDEKCNRRDGEHHMFLARVLLGNPFVCSKPSKFNRPPCATCKEELCKTHPDQFDSVIGTHRDSGDELLFREFIVYDKGLCYPEYLITYVRSSN